MSMSIYGGGNVAEASLKKDQNKNYSVEAVKLGLPSQVYQDTKNALAATAVVLQRGTVREEHQNRVYRALQNERQQREIVDRGAEELPKHRARKKTPPRKTKIEPSSGGWFWSKNTKALEEEQKAARERVSAHEDYLQDLEKHKKQAEKVKALAEERLAAADKALNHADTSLTGWFKWW